MPNDELLTTSQAAEFLGVSDSWIVRHRLNGTGPAFVKVGFFRKYLKSDLENYIRTNRDDPSTSDG